MARKKQQKKRNKKYQQKYTTGGRVDMSKGGRVSYQVGGNIPMKPKGSAGRGPNEEEERTNQLKDNFSIERTEPIDPANRSVPINAPKPITQPTQGNNQPIGKIVTDDRARLDRDIAKKDVIEPRAEPSLENQQLLDKRDIDGRFDPRDDFISIGGPGGGQDRLAADEAARKAAEEAARKAAEEAAKKAAEEAAEAAQQNTARESAEAAARGEVPEAAVIDKISIKDGTQLVTGKDQQTTTMQDVPGYTDTTVGQQQAEGQAPEQVTTGTAQTADMPTDVPAAEITEDELDIVDTEAQVDTAQGSKEDIKLAEAAGVDRVAPTEGADVKDPEGALAERVVGELSQDAMANAAKNAGTTLARVTRAKKQLRNAGLPEEAITELGNDPEALEARLMEFSEAERGIIAGLPEEALVSNQIDSLLNGMENGEIPAWAKPAVASVEAMLARRGLSASSVGRDNLFNAIIQSAVPIAQSNAQAIQQSVSQQKSIEAQAAEADAQRQQQVNLDKANKVFGMNMAQFNADQQTELANSKFLQTVGLTEASNDQQSTMQNAVLMSQANLAEASLNQQAQIQNAKNFLAMDMANLNAEQQSNVLRAQQTQQRLLSNQAATNAAAQFNAASENQTNQFMASLNAQVEQYNKTQQNAMEQFNATQTNAASARDAQRAADVEKFNTQLAAQIEQFNSNQDFARNQWNAQNQAAVEQSNTQWRRQVNTANTAMQNQINMQNAQNAFNLSGSAMSFLWQEMRDQADYDFRASENEKNRIAQIVNTALASTPDKYGSSISDVTAMIKSLFGTT